MVQIFETDDKYTSTSDRDGCWSENKNAKVGAATTNILKTLTGGKILSLTDMHGNGLRLKFM